MMGNGECILVVDDDPHIRNLALKQLKSMNYNVTVASNAREALKMILENGFRPELVISDVVMPGMNGKDLADLIVLHNPNQKILFILDMQIMQYKIMAYLMIDIQFYKNLLRNRLLPAR
jgi:CheY-like chemotaxis protein